MQDLLWRPQKSPYKWPLLLNVTPPLSPRAFVPEASCLGCLHHYPAAQEQSITKALGSAEPRVLIPALILLLPPQQEVLPLPQSPCRWHSWKPPATLPQPPRRSHPATATPLQPPCCSYPLQPPHYSHPATVTLLQPPRYSHPAASTFPFSSREKPESSKPL